MDQNKQTPARRRRSTKPASARKNYASEGDVLTDMPFPAHFPATPMKSNTASPAPGSQPANSRSTKKNKKPRLNHVATSPGPVRPGRRTPPLSATTKSGSAGFFAGANFHASPAPGSLPMPSFIRSESESAALKGPAKEPSPPASDCESPSPVQATTSAQATRDESPLDVLFRADRAEKERARRADSANASASGIDGPFSPPSETRSIRNSKYSGPPIPLNLPTRPAQRGVSEDSGTPGPAGPPEAFARPVHERIQAARAAEAYVRQQSPQKGRSHEVQQHQHPATPPGASEKSEELKRLLGIGGVFSSQKSMSVPLKDQTNAVASTPFSASGSHSSPQLTSGPASVLSSGINDLKFRAESELRQVLKLPFPVGSRLDGNNCPPKGSPGRA